uniref:RND family efflux transporter, MFP subunit n=1 Tax=Candidatus Kentrum eta TaxID=2126337 RepID=A0A450UAC4_9GAMM|nr:MAG: RND family efflux transporter, MFP subunit [Candidatus Kentron sp. H]VFJ89035.1 MAG: RND family efflux transporter, MFP subunit [Candidatus Kentron sp. H]VFJ95740.1 MAG: RND family efflux transporter, MFP subunit [Candidatus Kentron sp. H]
MTPFRGRTFSPSPRCTNPRHPNPAPPAVAMAQGHGEGVRGIGPRRLRQVQQKTDHILHLLLGGVPFPGDRLLDPGRRVFVDGQPPRDPRHEGRPPGLTEFQGGGGVAMEKDLLRHHLIRMVRLDDLADPIEDGLQFTGQIPLTHMDAAPRDVGGVIGLHGDDPEAGDAGTRIDAEDADGGIFPIFHKVSSVSFPGCDFFGPAIMPPAKLIAPLLVLALGAIAGWLLIATAPEAERRAPPPMIPTVEVMPLGSQDYTVTLTTRGAVSPRTQSTLIPEVAGRITEVSDNFRSGGFFEAGDILLAIDPRDYENAVTVMRSELAQARLALDEEKARVEQARIDWKRLGNGKPSDLVLRKPQLASKQAAVAAAAARLRQAKLDLERTRLKAPYAGRILEKHVDVGQYVSSGTVLATLYAVDYVEIRLPLTDEQAAFIHLPEAYRAGSLDDPPLQRPVPRPGKPSSEPASEQVSEPAPQEISEQRTGPIAGPRVTVSARIGRERHRWTGEIVRTEGALDPESRQLFVVAQIDDPYARREDRPPLRVGRFVEAEIRGRTLRDVFVIPSVALRVGEGEGGEGEAIHEVWLLGEGERLARRPVDVIWREAERAVIGEGLGEGERLVVTPLPYGVAGTVARVAHGRAGRGE